MLISSYGTGGRPLLKIYNAASPGIGSSGGGGCGGTGNFLAFVGIEFYGYTRDPNSSNFSLAEAATDPAGADFFNPFSWLLIEDCKFSFFKDDIVIQTLGGTSQNLSLRRNVITDSYSTDAHSQGIYIDSVDNVLVEENVFDHNGWNSSVSGADPTIFNHNVYIQTMAG